eukprot:scaffold10532_cov449-Chaetoceros_neogracile.AAC.24
MITSNSIITPSAVNTIKNIIYQTSDNVLSRDEQRKLKRIRNANEANEDMARIINANKARLTLDPDNYPAIGQRARLMEEGYGFVVAVYSPENTRDPPTVNVHYDI